ncbi:MAG TPA: hypothetical protein VLK89_04710 [Solirubrobacterales bacterium]|nr:hypothetical protein [Solirubrobacterales bacterium]
MRLLIGGGLATLVFTLALQAKALGHASTGDPSFEIATPFSPLIAESSSDTSVIVGLTIARTDPTRPTLDLRGRSVSRYEPEAYKVDTHISRIPCPGEYRFHAATEDSSNGNSSSYSALLRLFDPSAHPPGTPCNQAPPPLPGEMRVLLQDGLEKLFAVKGGRSNGGTFEGGLFLSSLPECDKTYTLKATLELAGWSRSAEFKVRAIELSSTLQGRTIEDKRC